MNMSRNFRDWLTVVLTGILVFVLVWKYLGFENAKSLLSMSNYPTLIITGAIALILGLKRSKWSSLFGIVTIVLFITGL